MRAFSSAVGLEAVSLHGRAPGQLAPLPGHLGAAAGELLLLLQQLVAPRLPLLLRDDPVLRHTCHLLSGSTGPGYSASTWRNGRSDGDRGAVVSTASPASVPLT